MTLLVSPSPRWSAPMAQLPGTGLVLFGGRTNTNSTIPGFFGDTWKWSGTAWTLVSTPGPSARGDAMMAYDGTNVTLVGGTDGHVNLSDTWSFSGTTWALQTTTPYSSPTTIRSGNMSYQSGATEAVLFGGTVSYQRHYVLDTWFWSGTSWSQLVTTTQPNARMQHSQASSATATVVFGGKNFDGPLSDTWMFNGSVWSQISTGQTPGTSSPSARYGASMVYDLTNSVYVLFGGVDANGYNGETWTFNIGTSKWTKQTPATAPSSRAFGSMAFDSTNHNALLFGGLAYDRSFGDSWIWNGSTLTWTQQ